MKFSYTKNPERVFFFFFFFFFFNKKSKSNQKILAVGRGGEGVGVWLG